jgi:hypothetical protein
VDALRRGIKASVVSAAPKVLTAKISWYVVRRAGPERLSSLRAIPALLIKTSRRPNLEVTCWAAVAIDSSEVTLDDEYQYHKCNIVRSCYQNHALLI